MVNMTRCVFVLLASVYLIPQVMSQMHCQRRFQSCLNGGTCDSYTGKCNCAAAKGTLCQYLDNRYTEGTDTCKAALGCGNGSECLEANGRPTFCMCDLQQAGTLCDRPLYQVKCTRAYVEFDFRFEYSSKVLIAAMPLLHYDNNACVNYSSTGQAIPDIESGWISLQGKSVFDQNAKCFNAIVTTEPRYTVYTLHYLLRYQHLQRLSEYDSVVTMQCKIHRQDDSIVQTSVEVRPFHSPDRKLDLHLRVATQGSFGDMKVLTPEGQPFPLQTALNIGDFVVFYFPFNQRQNLNDLTLGVMDIRAFPSDVTSGVQPTMLLENGCIRIPGAVAYLLKSTDFVRVYMRAFRFRQSDKLHLVFNISACREADVCACQDASRQPRDATTGTVTSAHSQGYTVTLKLKPLRESTRQAAPSFESCLKTSEFSALLAMVAVAAAAAVIALVCFWSRDEK